MSHLPGLPHCSLKLKLFAQIGISAGHSGLGAAGRAAAPPPPLVSSDPAPSAASASLPPEVTQPPPCTQPQPWRRPGEPRSRYPGASARALLPPPSPQPLARRPLAVTVGR